ncbi:MAG: PEP-CTERM sorting domain-containing protein [Desulfobacteraceae bacterium]
MKGKLLLGILFWLLILGPMGVASATILTFDDHPDTAQNSWGRIGSYGGFDFGCSNSNNRLEWIDTVSSSWDYGAISGDFTMVNAFHGSGIITSSSGGLFTFDGLWSRIWGTNPINRKVNIDGYLDGTLVWSSSYTLTQAWSHLAGGSGLIDELYLNYGTNFLVDNLALNKSGSIPTPEPSTMLLLGSGMVGLVGAARKKLKK